MTERTIQHILVTTGLTEAELADLLEGGSVSPLRESLLRSTLNQHPEIAKFFAGVRADRSAMRELDQAVHAPTGMLEAVEIRLDQEALRTLTEPVASAPIPISSATTRIERRSAIAVLLEQPWTRRLATAASLLLAIGIGVWGTHIGLQNWPKGGGTPPRNDSNLVQLPTTDPSDPPLPDASPTGLAIASAEPDAPKYTMLETTSLVDGPAIAADGTILSEEETVNLAGAGRLAIVISGDSRGLSDRLARLSGSSRSFQVAPIAETSVGASMPTLAAAMTRESELPRADWAAALQDPWSGTLGNADTTVSRRIMNVVSAADPASVRSILTTCGLLGESCCVPGRTVRVMILDEPIEQPVTMDAASVLWWSASPAKWARTTTVPVIIEE